MVAVNRVTAGQMGRAVGGGAITVGYSCRSVHGEPAWLVVVRYGPDLSVGPVRMIVTCSHHWQSTTLARERPVG
jgi:hypothetical protein